jgi:hypothetical protein
MRKIFGIKIGTMAQISAYLPIVILVCIIVAEVTPAKK